MRNLTVHQVMLTNLGKIPGKSHEITMFGYVLPSDIPILGIPWHPLASLGGLRFLQRLLGSKPQRKISLSPRRRRGSPRRRATRLVSPSLSSPSPRQRRPTLPLQMLNSTPRLRLGGLGGEFLGNDPALITNKF